MNRNISLLAMVFAFLAGPVWAAGAIRPAASDPVVIPPPVNLSTSDWTGFSTGLQLGYGNADASGAATGDGDGPLYGLRGYYDYDFGNFVLGGGLQFDGADIDVGSATTIESVLRLAARAGVDLDRNWLYGTWGAASASTSTVGDSVGYFLGAGYEVFLGQSLTAGAEVLYHRFEDFDLNNLDVEATTVGLSLNYRF